MVDIAIKGVGRMKEGSELEGDRGVGVSDVVLEDSKCQHLTHVSMIMTLPLAHLTKGND
jgi:hypothetical protein